MRCERGGSCRGLQPSDAACEGRIKAMYVEGENPAIEDQAINRAHRIGVAGSVTVTRMLTLGTIEERINQVLEEKRALFDQIFSQQEGPRQNVGLTQDEIFGLFNLRTPKGPLQAAA